MISSVAGRMVIALVATCVMATALYWGFLRNDDPTTLQGTRVALDFARLENGPAPTHFDTGQPATISRSPDDPGENFVVRDGKLTYDPAKDASAAAYFSSPDLGAPVTRIGARWVFTPRGDGHGAVALVVSHRAFDKRPWLETPFPIHFVVTPINWNLSVKKDLTSDLEFIAADSFAEPLKEDGATTYEADLSIDGDAVTIDLPDGTKRTVSDPRVSQWQGNFATFELYSNNGITDSVGGFQNIWAESIRDAK